MGMSNARVRASTSVESSSPAWSHPASHGIIQPCMESSSLAWNHAATHAPHPASHESANKGLGAGTRRPRRPIQQVANELTHRRGNASIRRRLNCSTCGPRRSRHPSFCQVTMLCPSTPVPCKFRRSLGLIMRQAGQAWGSQSSEPWRRLRLLALALPWPWDEAVCPPRAAGKNAMGKGVADCEVASRTSAGWGRRGLKSWPVDPLGGWAGG
jgi:hypothetical protein